MYYCFKGDKFEEKKTEREKMENYQIFEHYLQKTILKINTVAVFDFPYSGRNHHCLLECIVSP